MQHESESSPEVPGELLSSPFIQQPAAYPGVGQSFRLLGTLILVAIPIANLAFLLKNAYPQVLLTVSAMI